MIDELRGYRFYAADMLHPSEQAVDYIWRRFSNTYFNDETLQLKKELEQLRNSRNHRPFHPESTEYQHFLESIKKKEAELIKRFPF